MERDDDDDGCGVVVGGNDGYDDLVTDAAGWGDDS